jgi:riboflavin transporter
LAAKLNWEDIMNKRLKAILLMALFCALAVLGANIKIAGSIALDAMPAFLSAMLMGGPYGAIVGALGHLISALLSGFPFTVPLHLVIALEMAAICFLAGVLAKRGGKWVILSAVVTFVLNGVIAPMVLIVWPGMGWPAFVGSLVPLLTASAVNAFIAAILYYLLKKPYDQIIGRIK